MHFHDDSKKGKLELGLQVYDDFFKVAPYINLQFTFVTVMSSVSS